MIINEDLIINNLSLKEMDRKLTEGTTAKADLLFDGVIAMNNTAEQSGVLSAPWTDYDVLFIMACPGVSTTASVEFTTIPLYIFRKNDYNQTYGKLYSNIPDSYNATIRVSVKTSVTNRIYCVMLQNLNWSNCSVQKVYGIKFIS